MKLISNKEDLIPVIELVREDRKSVPYLYVNLRTYDPDDVNVKVWADYRKGRVTTVFLLYYDCLHFYTAELDETSLSQLKNMIKEQDPRVVMLPEAAGKAMQSYLEDYMLERNYIIDMDHVAEKTDLTYKSVVAKREDIVAIADLLLTEEEYSIVYDRNVLIDQMLDRYDRGISRYYAVIEDGKVVASCSSYGETDDLAAIGGVIVHKDWRRRGLAADVENHICEDLRRENKTRIGFVNYLNSPSLALHKKIGSVVHSTYYKYIRQSEQ